MNMPSFWTTSIKEAKPALATRSAPIVWSNCRTEEFAKYEENGFLISKQAHKSTLPSNVSSILEEIKGSRRAGRILERDSNKLRSQFDIHHQFPQLISSLFSAEALKLSTQILGGEPLLFQSHINFKYARVGGEYDWHSDFTYWRDQDGMLQPRAISVVIPLEKHGVENGGLRLLKGSHRYFYSSNLKINSKWNLNDILHDNEEANSPSGLAPMASLGSNYIHEISSAEMDFGDFLIMDANTWHSSTENNSESNRATLFVILITKETPFDERFRNHRPASISCRAGLSVKSLLERKLCN